MNYIVFSTLKNEIKNFENLLIDLNKQSLKPKKWYVYIDEPNYFDYTDIVKNSKTDFEIIIIPMRKELKTGNYYHQLALNLNYLLSSIPEDEFKSTKWFMKLDGDIRLYDKYYVKKLFYEIVENPEIYMISGQLNYNPTEEPRRYNEYPFGAATLIRNEVLDYWDRYPELPASDTVCCLTALMQWKEVRLSQNTKFLQIRNTSSRVNGSSTLSTAKKQYFLRYPLLLTSLYVIKDSPKEIFKFLRWVKNNKKDLERLRLNDPDVLRMNYIRLREHKFAKYIMWVLGK